MRIFLDQKKKRLNNIFLSYKKNFYKFKKYYDYDDPDYKGIRNIENLFGEVN